MFLPFLTVRRESENFFATVRYMVAIRQRMNQFRVENGEEEEVVRRVLATENGRKSSRCFSEMQNPRIPFYTAPRVFFISHVSCANIAFFIFVLNKSINVGINICRYLFYCIDSFYKFKFKFLKCA